ncbi:MAG: hypothetical protein U0768_22015 [Anaerolineae bacterium]
MLPTVTLRPGVLYILALVAAATFAIVGLYQIAPALPLWPHVAVGAALATTDAWLAPTVESATPSATLAQALQAIPGDGPLLFVAGPDQEYHQTYYATQYLAGLRPVTLLVCQAADQPAYYLTDPPGIDAVIMLAPSPPAWLAGGYRLGSHLTITPTSSKREWSAYCP